MRHSIKKQQTQGSRVGSRLQNRRCRMMNTTAACLAVQKRAAAVAKLLLLLPPLSLLLQPLQITPAIFNTGAGNGDEVSTSSVNADVAAAIAAASSTDTPLHVVVRHQGNPERPECFPGSKPNTQQSEAALAHPRVKKNAKGRAAILRPHRRNHTGRMHGATAIKLGNITAPSAAKRVQTSGGGRRRLLQNMNEHKLLVLYTDDAANGAWCF